MEHILKHLPARQVPSGLEKAFDGYFLMNSTQFKPNKTRIRSDAAIYIIRNELAKLKSTRPCKYPQGKTFGATSNRGFALSTPSNLIIKSKKSSDH
ncbi:unnamed protein product [Trichobilharzia regenti]|nr:unnamed protein product [Trichobilharzia regenti]